jgi:AcrR family transcriptional regulator
VPKISTARHDNQRANILMAARMVFARKGYSDATIKDICEQGGVSNGAYFTYFKSKKEPLLEIIEQNLGLFNVRIDEIVDKSGNQPFEESCIALLGVVKTIVTGPGRAMSIHVWSLSMLDEEIANHTRDCFIKINKSLCRLINKHRKLTGLKSKVTSVQAARALFSKLIPGYIVQILMVGDMEPKAYLDANRSFHELY